ncbi:FxLD family lanthipeptide [Streptomyces sp. NPDC002643]
MTVHLEPPIVQPVQPVQSAFEQKEPEQGDFDLDITIVESGPNSDHLIRLTDDGCGQTCESACNSSCP